MSSAESRADLPPETGLAFVDRVRMFGLSRVLLAMLLRKLEKSLGLHLWVFGLRSISSAWTPPAAHAETFAFRVVELQAALAAAADPALRLARDFVIRALGRGDICCGAFVGDRLVAYTWMSLGEAMGPHGIGIRVNDPRVAYGYKTFVHPDFRGQRLNASLIGFAQVELSRRGVEQLLGYVAFANLPSMKAYFSDPRCRRVGNAVLLDWPGLFLPLYPKALRRIVTLERHSFAQTAKTAG